MCSRAVGNLLTQSTCKILWESEDPKIVGGSVGANSPDTTKSGAVVSLSRPNYVDWAERGGYCRRREKRRIWRARSKEKYFTHLTEMLVADSKKLVRCQAAVSVKTVSASVSSVSAQRWKIPRQSTQTRRAWNNARKTRSKTIITCTNELHSSKLTFEGRKLCSFQTTNQIPCNFHISKKSSTRSFKSKNMKFMNRLTSTTKISPRISRLLLKVVIVSCIRPRCRVHKVLSS